ncbi:MAG: hypothetical protein JXX28_09960 [Deltaproteobacteria bacterium]|nr:hypothetical protein [Deltaproteobacteria bacterium]
MRVAPELITLLQLIRDRHASAAEVSRAATLLRAVEDLPEPLRAELDEEGDRPEAAAALLDLLGHGERLADLLSAALRDEADAPSLSDGIWGALDLEHEAVSAAPEATPAALDQPLDLPLAAALAHEAGEVELALEVARALGWTLSPIRDALADEAGQISLAGQVAEALAAPVAEAVRAEAGDADLAAGIAATLSLPCPPIRGALTDEAGEVDLASACLAALGYPAAPVAEAVRAQAGEVELRPEVSLLTEPGWVSGLLDNALPLHLHRLASSTLSHRPESLRELNALAEQGHSLRGALREEAGEVALWGGIAAQIGVEDAEQLAGYEPERVADAVRAEAGVIDITQAVMTSLRRSALGRVPTVEPPANHVRGLVGALLIASAFLLTVLFSEQPEAQIPEAPRAMQFADAREITVNELSWSQDAMVQLIQSSDEQGAEGALIIWVDEEVVL